MNDAGIRAQVLPPPGIHEYVHRRLFPEMGVPEV